jgi:hypothetical protein
MQRDIFFIEPTQEGATKDPPWEMILTIADILKAAGFDLRYAQESGYIFDKIKQGIQDKGIVHYTNSIPLREHVLPDNTKLEEHLDLLRHMVRNIQASVELLIIDPYLFPDNPDADYITHLGKVFERAIGNISRLEIVTRPNHDATVEAEFLKMAVAIKPGVTCRVQHTKAFHDRFWIADGTRGIFVGTSLNGIGKRYSIADYLREDDVKDIYARFIALS